MMEGGCLCGAVRYRVEGAPVASGVCHCRSCRRASSAPSLPYATFAVERFVLIRGAPVGFGSSAGVERRFCGRCGSPISYRSEAQPGLIDVMSGSLDDPDAVPPAMRIWTCERLAWDRVGEALPAYAGSGPGAGADR